MPRWAETHLPSIAPPDELATVALGVAKKGRLHRLVVNDGVGLETDSAFSSSRRLAATSSTRNATWQTQR